MNSYAVLGALLGTRCQEILLHETGCPKTIAHPFRSIRMHFVFYWLLGFGDE
jgi:hypothetical protein